MENKRDKENEDDFLFGDEICVEEEDVITAQRPKKKKRKMNRFIEMEAEEDDVEDEADDEEVEGLIADDDPEATEDRERTRVQHLQRKQLLEDDDPEAYAAYIQERFGELDEEYDSEPETSYIDQQSLLPTDHDPRLFIVRVNGYAKERKAVFTLLQKYFTLERKGVDLNIISAVAPGNSKRYVYVEAFSSEAVKQAISGLNIFKYGVRELSVDEMTDVMKVAKKTDELKENEFVRVRRGLYKNDLAQFYQRIPGKDNYVMIRLIPRLSIKGKAESKAKDDAGGDKSSGLLVNRRRKPRPPQKLFDKEEIYRLIGSADIHQQRDLKTGKIFDVWNNEFYRHGLLHMETHVRWLIQGSNVNPQVDEIEKWQVAEQKLRLLYEEDPSALTSQEASAGLSLKFGSTSSDTTKTGLYKGDNVRVDKGEQKGLTGAITEFDRDMCLIQSPDFPETLRVNKKDVVKIFNVGMFVKVTSGKHSGEFGSIVHVEGEFLTIFTDSTRKHTRVLASHVADLNDPNVSATVHSRLQSQTTYGLFELVSLVEDNTKGVVLEVFNDAVAILNTHNRVMRLPFSSIKNKVKDKSARASDARGNPIARNDTIHVIAGRCKDRSGVVLHVSDPYIFFRAQDETKNCGIVACSASNVTAHTAAAIRLKSSLGNNRRAPAPIPLGAISGFGSGGVTDRTRRLNTRGGSGCRPPPKDTLLNKEVKVTKGEFKGDTGIVIHVDAKFVRVQVPSKMKTVHVAKDKVKVVGADGTAWSKATGESQVSESVSKVSKGEIGRSSSMILNRPTPSVVRTPHDTNYSQTSASLRYRSKTPAVYRHISKAPCKESGGNTPGPSLTTPRAFGFGSVTPRRDAFRPITSELISNPCSGSRTAPRPITPASVNPYQPLIHPIAPTSSGNIDQVDSSTPRPFYSVVVEPRTTPHNYVPNSPTLFTTSKTRSRAPQNSIELHTTRLMETDVQPSSTGFQLATLASGREPCTPVVETTDPESPIDTKMLSSNNGDIGYEVLIDVVISIPSENGDLGVVKEASADGSFVRAQMINGSKQGQDVGLTVNDITPLQPSTNVDLSALQAVKVLDGDNKGKVGELTAVLPGNVEDPEGVVRLQSGERQNLKLSCVAKCQVNVLDS